MPVPKSLEVLTPYQRHLRRWEGGCGTAECSRAGTVVVKARGTGLPCDVLFVGEAPGVNEDALGRPFVGPAGHLLDDVIRRAIPEGVSYALTNLVGCIPRDEDGKKAGTPEDEQIKACAGRLVELIGIAVPRLIVAVGKLPEEWLDPQYKRNCWAAGNPGKTTPAGGWPGTGIPRVAISHPAAILRAPVAQQNLMIRRCVVTLTKAVEKLK